jgi:hypothetical protein
MPARAPDPLAYVLSDLDRDRGQVENLAALGSHRWRPVEVAAAAGAHRWAMRHPVVRVGDLGQVAAFRAGLFALATPRCPSLRPVHLLFLTRGIRVA